MRGFLAALIAGLGVPLQNHAAQNGILREVYTNISGTSVSDLTSHSSFPANPSSESLVTDVFEAPINVLDNYGQRMRGLITAPQTGNYTFWISSDDGGVLYLSSDEDPGNKVEIASVPGWTASRQWNKYSEQRSSAQSLVAGKKYYIEALMKEAGGGDNLAVRWRLPNNNIEEPIPASRLEPVGLEPPNITQQPSDRSVSEGQAATFTVGLSKTLGITYQWQRRDGGIWSNIAGATDQTYVFPVASLDDSGTQFRVQLANSQGNATSAAATLTVNPDSSRPVLLSAGFLGDNTLISVLFSEPVETASAENPSNYSLSDSASVLGARLSGDFSTVILTVSPLDVGVNYTLSVSNVRDRASVPNEIVSNSQTSFSLEYTPLSISAIQGKSEPVGPSTRRTGFVITEIMYHPPDRSDGKVGEYIELFNSNEWDEDIGGFRLSGAVDFTIPERTIIAKGEYLVMLRSRRTLRIFTELAASWGDLRRVWITTVVLCA